MICFLTTFSHPFHTGLQLLPSIQAGQAHGGFWVIVRVGFFSAGSGGWGPAVIDAAPKKGRPESGAVALPKRPGEPTTGAAAVCTEHTHWWLR
jgi:hypothetical protein